MNSRVSRIRADSKHRDGNGNGVQLSWTQGDTGQHFADNIFGRDPRLKGITVASRALSDFQFNAVDCSLTADAFAAPPSTREAIHAEATDSLYESPAESRKWMKGVMVAIGLEVGVGLFFYGLWQAWQVLR